jgi:hypothetical protein
MEMIQETLPPINEQLIADSPLSATAATTKLAWPNPSQLMQQLEMLDVTLNIFNPAVTKTLQLWGTHEMLGLVTEQHPNTWRLSSSPNVTLARCRTRPSDDGKVNSKTQLFDWLLTHLSLTLINSVKY